MKSADVDAQSNAHRSCISVCIVTFNQAQFIEQCVDSVYAQRGVGDYVLQVIVGDDCSTDETPERLAALKSRHPDLEVLRHKTNIGGARNHLSVIEMARGEFVAHLDGDDFWLPGKLAAQMGFLQENRSCIAVCTNAIVVNAVGREVGVFTNAEVSRFGIDYLVEGGNFINHSSLLYRASVAHAVLSTPTPYIDFTLLLSLCKEGDIGFIDQPLAGYRANLQQSVQKTDGESVRTLYREALFAAIPLASPRSQRRAAANYVAYRLLFGLQGKAPHLEFEQFMRCCRAANVRPILLGVLTAMRVAGLAWAVSVNAIRRRFIPQRVPVVYHARY
ncbi:glycosyltransferase [Variovorax sp. KK3]|uniref:glycosyltransferase family 2 protein n=1 Tax=Variovorax sp. KK3 TaxID=1855728 RepID=UPI00097C29BB|nr:glycosyltransferase [Variovorax sp. KK3]